MLVLSKLCCSTLQCIQVYSIWISIGKYKYKYSNTNILIKNKNLLITFYKVYTCRRGPPVAPCTVNVRCIKVEELVYKATVTRSETTHVETYTGLTGGSSRPDIISIYQILDIINMRTALHLASTYGNWKKRGYRTALPGRSYPEPKFLIQLAEPANSVGKKSTW